ncbi:MAG: CpaF family protein, partial [Candidatus Hadarchaeota archaeon]
MAKKAGKKAKTKAAGVDFFGGGGGLLADVFSGAPAAEQKAPAAGAKEPAAEKGPITISAMEAGKPAAPRVEKGPVTGKVIDKYGNVEIMSVETEPTPYYKTALPELGAKEIALLEKVKDTAIEEVRIDPEKLNDPAERNRIFTQAVFKILERESRTLRLPPGRMRQLGEIAVRDMIGFGLLDPLLADDRLEDIMVTAVGKPVYVYHRKHGMCHTNIIFNNEDSIKYLIDKMARVVGRRIDQQTPLLDARLPDGSRVNATIPPVSLDGPTISIRKFRKDPLSVIDIINFNTLSTDFAAFLWFAVDGLGSKPANLLLSGGTGCGKTTMLNSASNFVPGSERIISIEDTAELQLPHKHWVRMETRPPNVEGKGEITMDDLVKNALRMRPDRMVVGEVRGPEARTMFTAMNTGHDGCMGTVHANSASETVT